ncbi:hypothetical protein Dda_9322 [Drechslerella dactyloides]|uniref:Uncharacterized protein n=1 Tax=Drechslerella dactyloides TaxID=74499 RepID=A0AAD6NGL6_DREDA|nr:hypothetical protein Dda_9322 [Drechslerella dactyloides]
MTFFKTNNHHLTAITTADIRFNFHYDSRPGNVLTKTLRFFPWFVFHGSSTVPRRTFLEKP